MTQRVPEIDIVIPTLNRPKLLKRLFQNIRESLFDYYHIVIVHGGNPETVKLVEDHPLYGTDGMTVVHLPGRVGAVRANNAGFAVCKTDYVFNLNDDCEIVGNPVELALQVLKRDRKGIVGQVIIPFVGPHEYLKVDAVGLAGDTWHYANFGVTRREVGDRVGWWGDRLYQYGGDAWLSMRIWNEGMMCAPIMNDQAYIRHLEAKDDTRVPNDDSEDFYRIWQEWKGPGSDLDFLSD